MDVNLRVTDAPEESSFSDLVSGDNVLSIPLFQRPYRWTNKHLQLLLDDVEAVSEDTAASVFLGVIVTYSRGTGPGRPVTWEVVDGQQRVTTLYLLVMAAIEVASRKGANDWAAAVTGSYLLVRPLASNPVNTKLVPSYADRAQFAALWARIADLPGLKADKSFAFNPPMPPPASGPTEGEMADQYRRLRQHLARMADAEGVDALERFVEIVVRHLSFVSISLRDPAVAPKIFERLNARAEPVTIADLVRNEVFSRSGGDAVAAQHVFNTYWEPFAASFKATNTDLAKFLFPYGLIGTPNLRKADLFAELRRRWSGYSSPQDIIADLVRYRGTYLALEGGVADPDLPAEISRHLHRVHSVGRPSSTYAFILRLVDGWKQGAVSEGVVVDILTRLESFLFRRAIMGIEPTGLHAVFKGLWNELVGPGDGSDLVGDDFQIAISAKPTIVWPNGEQFSVAVRIGNLYGRKVRNYALREHEASLSAETASDIFQVEHVAPQSATDAWREKMGEPYDRLIHTWGNLVPISGKMNPAIGQKAYALKRPELAKSMFANARDIAETCEDWTAESLAARNQAIADWACTRWPH